MTENLTVGHRIKCRFMSLSYSGSHGTMAVLLLHTLGKRYQCPYRTSLQGRLGIFFLFQPTTAEAALTART